MDNTGASRLSLGRAVAAIVVALETLLLVAVGVGYVVYAFVDTNQDATPAVVLAVSALLLAAGLGACAWGLWHARRWARSIALTWQLLQVAAAVVVWTSSPQIAVALCAASVLVVAVVVRDTQRDMRSGIEP